MTRDAETRSLKRTGSIMLIGAWLLLLGLLTLYFDTSERTAVNPNQKPTALVSADGIREVVLQRNRYNHYLAGGTINGQQVNFLLDTGASDVVIPEPLAKKLGLKRGPAGTALTANGPVRVYHTRIASLRIGSIELRNVRASINTGMQNTGVLLGMSALKDIEFIQRGDKLTLRQFPMPGGVAG